jgi:hypothetical protein
MDVPWLLVAHGSVTALVVVSFLCGQWPIFEGTFVQRINHFLTFGAYHHLLRLVHAACGNGARDLVLGVESYCCDRPNPILQVRIANSATHWLWLFLNLKRLWGHIVRRAFDDAYFSPDK